MDELEKLSAEVEQKRRAMMAHQMANTYGKTEIELARMSLASERATRDFIRADDALRRAVGAEPA